MVMGIRRKADLMSDLAMRDDGPNADMIAAASSIDA